MLKNFDLIRYSGESAKSGCKKYLIKQCKREANKINGGRI